MVKLLLDRGGQIDAKTRVSLFYSLIMILSLLGNGLGFFSLLAFGDFFVCLFYVDCFLCYQTKEQLVLVIVGGRNTISFSLL